MSADLFAVQQTPARYALALDQHDYPALEGVLTEDASWTFEGGPGPVTGRAAILDFVRGAADAQTDRRRHHLGTVLVDRMDAGTAVVRAYLMLTSDDGPRLVATGGYTFTLVRDGDSWRIASLTLRLDNAG